MTIVFPAPIVEELLITIGSKKRTTWVYRKSQTMRNWVRDFDLMCTKVM